MSSDLAVLQIAPQDGYLFNASKTDDLVITTLSSAQNIIISAGADDADRPTVQISQQGISVQGHTQTSMLLLMPQGAWDSSAPVLAGSYGSTQQQVTTAALADSAVTTNKLADSNVTSAKLDSNLSLSGTVSVTQRLLVGLTDCNATPHAVHVQGSVYASGNVIELSDARLKTDIVRLDQGILERLKGVHGYTYRLTEHSDRRRMGVLAQELLPRFPEAIYEGHESLEINSANEHTEAEKVLVQETQEQRTQAAGPQEASRTGTMAVSYSSLSAVFIEALNELNEKLTNISARVATLEGLAQDT